ncbi:MAG: hypothetical protein IJL32_11605 [Oscillospiraceae bacterium]|nr:hypothetical protein [Oscillospiraceae bacterium]
MDEITMKIQQYITKMAKSGNSLHEKCALNRFMGGGRCAERPAASDAALISSGEVILHGYAQFRGYRH